MSTLPIILCIIDPKNLSTQVKEGLDLVQKIKEIEPTIVLDISFDVNNSHIIIMTSKAFYNKIKTIETTIDIILKQNNYINKKGK